MVLTARVLRRGDPSVMVVDDALTFRGDTQPFVSLVNSSSSSSLAISGSLATFHANANVVIDGTLVASGGFIGDGSGIAQETLRRSPIVSSVAFFENATFQIQIDDTALSTDPATQHYVRVLGQGFGGGAVVVLGDQPVFSTTVVSATEIRAVIAGKSPAATHTLLVVNTDGTYGTYAPGLASSSFPVWTGSASLENVTKNVGFTRALSSLVSSDSSIVSYDAVTSLPPGTTLANTGILSGTITNDIYNTTTYSFDVTATDAEFQDAVPRTFFLTALGLPGATGGT